MNSGTSALLADGTVVTVRPLAEADTDAVLALHRGLSERDRYLRFFTTRPAGVAGLAHTIVTGTGLGAFRGDRLIGVAHYAMLGDAETAEMAVVIDETAQAHGVGTLLLEHLVLAARRHGVRRFLGEVLTENRRMVRVLTDFGLPYSVVHDGPYAVIELELGEPDRYLDAVAERERTADIASLRAVLAPASVAVVGAGRKPGSVGHAILRNLVDAGFGGELYAVNPHADTIAGVACVPSPSDLPGAVDLAVICVPADAVPGAVAECGRRGVRAVVVITAGLTGTGLADRVRASARRFGIRVVGPNCFGVANTAPEIRLDATFAHDTVPGGRVGVVTQSGGFGIALLESLGELGLGVSTFVSTGDKYDVSGNDLLLWWTADERTDIAVLYLESFGNPRKFGRFARRLARRKPVLAIRGAGTSAAQRAATAHTAATAVSAGIRDALFAQAGVTVVDTVAEMIGLLAALSWQPLPAGDRVAIVSNAGGAAVLAAEACAGRGLDLPALSKSTMDTLRGLLPEHAGIGNPIDTSPVVSPAVFTACVEAVLADERVDAVLVAGVPTAAGDPLAGLRLGRHDKPVVAVAPGNLALVSRSDGGVGVIPVYGDAVAAAAALAAMAARARWLRGEPARDDDVRPPPGEADLSTASRIVHTFLSDHPSGGELSEKDSVELVGAFGVRVADEAANSADVVIRGWQDETFGPVVRVDTPGRLANAPVRLTPLAPADIETLLDALPGGQREVLRGPLMAVGWIVDVLPEVAVVEVVPLTVTADGRGAAGAVRVTVRPAVPGAQFLRRLRT
ncbi:GNAT family N-acetyltransferase [Amycolatopsis sp. NPDC059021]|uniref:GNAT family N-acetyltransferase n=1 Tax=Amycolatopsis sp. NPDC059021 TaxID=3346704 RepID=UPI00366BFCA9